MRSSLRLLRAAIAGYVVLAAGASAGTFLARLAFPQTGQPFPTTPFLSVSVAIGFAAAMAGGYVCARLSPSGWRLESMAMLVVLVLGLAVLGARLSPEPRQPPGFLPLVTLLGVIGLWAGAMAERAVHGGPK